MKSQELTTRETFCAITGMRGLMMKVGVGVSVLVVNGSADVIISNA